MIEGMGNYLSSKPRRAAMIVLVTAVALIMVLAALMVQVVQSTGVFDPPYPSDNTPLSLADNGITWTRDFIMVVQGNDGEWGMNYSEYRFFWGFESTSGSEGWMSGVADDTDESILSGTANATISTYLGTRTPWFDAPNLTMYLDVTDISGDGVFGIGDHMTIRGAPRTEGLVYTVGLAWIGHGTMNEEYSYAFHEGKFYSWVSNRLPATGPWWET